MFNKFWREYPLWLQLLLLILMLFVMVSASSALAMMLIPRITGVSLTDIQGATKGSSPEALNALKWFLMIVNLLTFAGTAVLYAYSSHPDRKNYLGFRRIQKPVLVVYALVFSLAALPFILQLATWISDLNISAAATEIQKSSNEKMEALLNVHTVPSFLFTLFVLGIVPALGEELLFRGVVMRFLHKQTKNIHFSVFASAAVFAFFHGVPYSLLSILMMGMLLGYIYYYTGSIWVNMIVHFVHNGVQITMSYLAMNGIIAMGMENEDNFEWYVLVVGVLIAGVFFYLMQRKATPLPDGWSSDFPEKDIDEDKEETHNLQ